MDSSGEYLWTIHIKNTASDGSQDIRKYQLIKVIVFILPVFIMDHKNPR